MATPAAWIGPQACVIDPTERAHNAVKFGGKYISLRQLADATGLDNGYLSRVVNGKRTPGTRKLLAIVNALRMSSMEEFISCVDRRVKSLDDERVARRLYL